MADILMAADPVTYEPVASAIATQWLSRDEFWQAEALVKQHDTALWQSFNTHGKYQRIAERATWFAVAVDDAGAYLSSAIVVALGHKWLVEYLMTTPTARGQGAGTAVMNEIMGQAKAAGAQWVVLNCDPTKNDGQLPAFYAKFGFAKVA